MFKKLDIKTIFILILGLALILMFIFRPSKNFSNNEEELKKLKERNEELMLDNEKLKLKNDSLDSKIRQVLVEIIEVDKQLSDNERKIRDLKNGKGKVSGFVRTLNADGVAIELSDYIKRREGKGSN